MKTLWTISIVLFAFGAQAAVNNKSGLSISSPEGFELQNLSTAWFQSPPPPEKVGVHMQFRSPDINDGYQGLMTVRIDKETGKARNVKEYVNQWLGDYKKLGYTVLGSQAFAQEGNRGYVVDVLNKKSGKQVRQVVFFRPKRAIIFTCIDRKNHFKNSLSECNKITQSFAWADLSK